MASGYQFITDSSGDTYAIDSLLVYQIARNYASSTLRLKHAQVKTLAHPDFSRWNPLSWGLPDLHQVEVDWDQVRQETAKETAALIDEFEMQIRMGGRSIGELRSLLLHYITLTRQNKDKFFGMLQTAQRETMKNIDSSVSSYKTAIKSAEFVRDGSATTLLVGATLMSGGTAMAVAGGGSALKGVGKYQSTGNWGLAMWEATSSFTMFLIPVAAPKNLPLSEKLWLGFTVAGLEIGRDIAMGLAEGAILNQDVRPAKLGTEIGAKQAGNLYKDFVCKEVIDMKGENLKKLSLPTVLKFAGQVACNIAVDHGAKAGPEAMFADAKQQAKESTTRFQAREADQLLYADDKLARRAVIGPNRSADYAFAP